MLPDSTGSHKGSAIKIGWVRWIPELLVVEQVGRKNTE